MKIAVGSDERTHLTDTVIEELQKRGHDLLLFGPLAENDPEVDWPLTSSKVAESVAIHKADEGIVFCWTGTALVRKPAEVQRRFDVCIREGLSIGFPSHTAFLCKGERVLIEIEHVALLDKEVVIMQHAFSGAPQYVRMSLQGKREPLACKLEVR